MKKTALYLGFALLISACSSSNTSETTAIVTSYSETAEETTESKAGTTESTVEIKGMSCAIMCGNMIKDNVSGMTGVASVEIDFDQERATNFANVTYNAEQTSPKAIAEKIESLNDGSYKVIAVNTTNWIKAKVEEVEGNEEEVEEDETTAYININDILPSVFGVFTYVFN